MSTPSRACYLSSSPLLSAPLHLNHFPHPLLTPFLDPMDSSKYFFLSPFTSTPSISDTTLPLLVPVTSHLSMTFASCSSMDVNPKEPISSTLGAVVDPLNPTSSSFAPFNSVTTPPAAQLSLTTPPSSVIDPFDLSSGIFRPTSANGLPFPVLPALPSPATIVGTDLLAPTTQ
ncbi:hypothetical protein AMTRI_Chr11g100440 [Amborella trichopoda]